MLMHTIKKERECNEHKLLNKRMSIICAQVNDEMKINKEPTKDMSAIAGLKLWGDKVLTAILKQFKKRTKDYKKINLQLDILIRRHSLLN